MTQYMCSIGNIFLGYFAGHETTADTLAFILIQLAHHPEEQEQLYRHVTSIFQGCQSPVCMLILSDMLTADRKQEYSDAHRFSRTAAYVRTEGLASADSEYTYFS